MSNFQKKFFRVSREWMEECGQGDEPRVYPVIRVEESPASRESDIIVLKRDNGSEWSVFPHRGVFVPPYTVLIENRQFMWTTADVQTVPGQLHVPMYYYTEAEAKETVKTLNAAMHTLIVAETKTAQINTVPAGKSVSRLYKSGAPMKGVFTVGHADPDGSGYIALTDEKGRTIWIKPHALVAVL
jgi:hypothetical protein